MLSIVGLEIGIDQGSLGIDSHAAGTEQVHAELLFIDGKSPFLFCAGGVEKFHGTISEPVFKLEIVGMIFVGEAKRGKSPGIFQIGIDGEAVVLDGQRCTVAEIIRSALESLRKSGL